MSREEKQLLLITLCSMLPYETFVQYEGKEWLVTGYGHGRVSLLPGIFSSGGGPCPLVEEVKPYLRPMSSMTEEEYQEFGYDVLRYTPREFDWLNTHHFDYRGLIEKGLALEAPKDMYKTE